MANLKPNKTSFKPGQSGNAAGRPPGKTARGRFRELVEPDMQELVQTLLDMAKGGDVQAIRVILDKTVPNLKASADNIKLRASGTLEETGAAVISSMTRGAIAPDEALTVMGALATQAKLIEQQNVVARLDQLEAMLMTTQKELR